MDVFTKLAVHPVFTVNELEKMTGNSKTAYSQLDRLMKNNLVKKIRKNLYSPINPVTGQIVANRYQIACAITPTAYISHHSAFEYYGLANQVFNELNVSSDTKFNSFEYDQVVYKWISSRIKEGVIAAKNTEGIRVTDLERTVIDSISDSNKIAGYEELLNCLDSVNYLDEDKLLQYLAAYNTQGLYQRAGFLLNHYREQMQLTDDFITYCRKKIGKSTRYLFKEYPGKSSYYGKWKLVVPDGIFNINDQGGDFIV